MIVSGISPQQFAKAVAKAGMQYGNNIRPIIGREYVRKDGTCQRFGARVGLLATGYGLYGKGYDLAPGQRRSGNVMGGQRRVNAVCWHVYRDVLVEVFKINPDAKIKTAMAKYYGAQAFYRLYSDTAYHNIGSMMFPVTMPECCDCGYSPDPTGSGPIPEQFAPVDIIDRIDELVNESLISGWRTQD